MGERALEQETNKCTLRSGSGATAVREPETGSPMETETLSIRQNEKDKGACGVRKLGFEVDGKLDFFCLLGQPERGSGVSNGPKVQTGQVGYVVLLEVSESIVAIPQCQMFEELEINGWCKIPCWLDLEELTVVTGNRVISSSVYCLISARDYKKETGDNKR